jgi:hypothetical protein
MDMKRILQAMDGVATKPVAGANDMAKFLRVVDEAAVKVPPVPALPPEDGEPTPGERVVTNQDGTRSYSGAFGTFTYDKSGKATKYTTPNFNGLGQTVDLTNNQTTQNYSTGPLNVTQTTDAKGNVVSSNSEYDLGVGKMSMGKDANGITSKSYTPAGGEQGIESKDIYALGNKDKEATYNRAMAQVNGAALVQENSLNKFLSIVRANDVSILNEGANPHKVSLPVQMAMQHYQKQSDTPARPVGRTNTFGKYFHKVEAEVNEAVAEEQAHKRQLINQYASVIAERVLMKEAAIAISKKKKKEQQADESLKSDNPCWKGYHPVGTKKKGGRTVPNCVPTNENEVPGTHSLGFKPGPGSPGIQSAVAEAPIAMDPSEPNNPTIHGHQKANAMTLKGRIMSARAQLKELAQLAERDDLLAWEEICKKSKGGMFMGLEQNLEQIRHGLEQLAAKRRKGGVASRGIDKNIGEAVTPTIKPAKPKAIKPKAKTSTCRAGQTQTGVQTKDGKTVPKCSVVKKGF